MSGKGKAAGAPSWMVTFADMMSLLLALFVLMLSFSSMDAQRYKKIAGAMRDSFGLQPIMRLAGVIELGGNPSRQHLRYAQPVPIPGPFLLGPLEQEDREETDVAAPAENPTLARIERKLAGAAAAGMLSVAEKGGRIVVTFPESASFASGSAALSPAILPVLDKLAAVLEATKGEIRIAGHTDSTPIENEKFRSNWDLSTARAVSVVHYWLKHSSLPGRRLTPEGHAATCPLVKSCKAEDQALNRRVEISVITQ